MSKKRKKDPDYVQREDGDEDLVTRKPKRGKFLSNNSKEVWEYQKRGLGPAEIARTISRQHGLRAGAVEPKQVSNFIHNHKKAGVGKTRSVSLKHNNLDPADDDCVFFSII